MLAPMIPKQRKRHIANAYKSQSSQIRNHNPSPAVEADGVVVAPLVHLVVAWVVRAAAVEGDAALGGAGVELADGAGVASARDEAGLAGSLGRGDDWWRGGGILGLLDWWAGDDWWLGGLEGIGAVNVVGAPDTLPEARVDGAVAVKVAFEGLAVELAGALGDGGLGCVGLVLVVGAPVELAGVDGAVTVETIGCADEVVLLCRCRSWSSRQAGVALWWCLGHRVVSEVLIVGAPLDIAGINGALAIETVGCADVMLRL